MKYTVVSFQHGGDFNKTVKFLDYLSGGTYIDNKLNKFGQMGVDALSAATPVDTGKTAQSWSYSIYRPADGVVTIVWKNSNVSKDWANVAVLVDTGHATRNGGYVFGRHYIEPAIVPVFEKIADELWKEVTSK